MTANECFTCGYPWVRPEHAPWCTEVDGKRVHVANRNERPKIGTKRCPICGGGIANWSGHRRTKVHQAALR